MCDFKKRVERDFASVSYDPCLAYLCAGVGVGHADPGGGWSRWSRAGGPGGAAEINSFDSCGVD